MSDDFDQLATTSGAIVQVDTTGHCLNEYMIIEGGAQIGDHLPCDAGCGDDHEVRHVIGIDLVATVEIPARQRPARERGVDGQGVAGRGVDGPGLELGGSD